MNNLISIVFFFLITYVNANRVRRSEHKSPECETIYQSLGHELESVFFLKQNNIPTDLKKMNSYCVDLQKSLSVFKRYSKQCLSAFARQINNIVASSLRKLIRYICKSDKEKTTVAEILSCVMPQSLVQWKSCTDSANKQFDYIGQNSTAENFIADMCCMDVLLHECARQVPQSPSCTSKNINLSRFLIDLVDHILKDVIETTCYKFSNKQDCAALNPIGLKTLEKVSVAKINVEGPLLIGPLLRAVPKLTS